MIDAQHKDELEKVGITVLGGVAGYGLCSLVGAHGNQPLVGAAIGAGVAAVYAYGQNLTSIVSNVFHSATMPKHDDAVMNTYSEQGDCYQPYDVVEPSTEQSKPFKYVKPELPQNTFRTPKPTG